MRFWNEALGQGSDNLREEGRTLQHITGTRVPGSGNGGVKDGLFWSEGGYLRYRKGLKPKE